MSELLLCVILHGGILFICPSRENITLAPQCSNDSKARDFNDFGHVRFPYFFILFHWFKWFFGRHPASVGFRTLRALRGRLVVAPEKPHRCCFCKEIITETAKTWQFQSQLEVVPGRTTWVVSYQASGVPSLPSMTLVLMWGAQKKYATIWWNSRLQPSQN